MNQYVKRVVSIALAAALSVQVCALCAWSSPVKGEETVSVSGMHPFTGTPDLIQSAVEDLKAQGQTVTEDEPDAKLVNRVEKSSGMSFDTVKSTLTTALTEERDAGVIDVEELGLSKEDMAEVMQDALYDTYMNNAISNVSYTTSGGKVTEISYEMSEGYAAALDAVEEEADPEIMESADEAVQEEAAEQAAYSISVMAEDAEGSACTNHTVGGTSLRGDCNGDGTVDVFDVVEIRNMVLGEAEEKDVADCNQDGVVDLYDVVKARNIASGIEEAPSMGSGTVEFTWAEYADITPVTDAEGNVLNGGLIYNAETKQIEQGILPNYYWTLTKISFQCAECGEEIVIEDPEVLKSFVSTYDIYVNVKTGAIVQCEPGQKPELGEGETEEDYLLYTDMNVATYTDDTFKNTQDEEGNYIGLYVDSRDNGALEVERYYGMMSAFNADNAEYMGVSTDYWTSKNTEGNPMGAVKAMCNLDPNQDVPPAQMIQMVQMLPQAFMAYVMYYGPELLAMRDQAMAAVDALPEGATEVQKLLVLHDWLAENATFDMGAMTTINQSGGTPETDPIQMTTFGCLLSNQLSEMPTYADENGQQKKYYGAICLGYAAGYSYLVQNMHPEIYKTEKTVTDEEGNETTELVWCTPEEVDANGGDVVDFVQVMFYADTADTSVAGEGFGGGAFNNVHYMNAVRLPDAPNADTDGEWFFVDACYDDIYVECMTQYRGEADGSVYHMYFLVSPETMGNLYEGSIDYIDSQYDGVTYVPQVDENGNVLVPSDNIPEDSESYDPNHPKYEKVENPDEIKSNNVCYEDSWFSGAISKIYNDGTNWYYVDGGTTLASYRQMMEQGDDSGSSGEDYNIDIDAMMHSNRVDRENGDKMKMRAMTDPDYWEDSSSGSSGFMDSAKEDTYAEILFDYGTGEFPNDTDVEGLELADEVKLDFTFNEQYPALTHSLGLYGNQLYFNLNNTIYTYNLAAEDGVSPLGVLKEYNDVTYSADGRAFTATSYYVDPEGDKKVSNKPIAALCVYNDYDFANSYDPIMQDGQVVGLQFNPEKLKAVPTMTVNIATNYTFSYPNMDESYTKEAINYNPDYQLRLSDENDNANEEFLWCANIREDMPMEAMLADLSGETSEVSVDATCYSPAFTQKRTNAYGLVAGDKVIAEGAEATGHNYVYNAEEQAYICENCNLHAAVVMNVGENGTATMTSLADSGMGDLGGIMGGDSEVTPVDPEREAATKAEGGMIQLNITPDEGYQIGSVYYVAETPAAEEETPDEPETAAETDETVNKVEIAQNGEGVYEFTKPAECVTVYVEFEEVVVEPETYTVTAAAAENGTVEVSPEEAKADDTVKITATPAEGYKIAEVTYTYTAASGEEKTETLTAAEDGTYTFTMPAADVTVSAEFEQDVTEPETTYLVNVTPTENGTVEVSPKEAKAGEIVTVTATPNDGFKTAAVTYAYADADGGVQKGELTAAEDGTTYTFIMPAADDVTVTVTFEPVGETGE